MLVCVRKPQQFVDRDSHTSRQLVAVFTLSFLSRCRVLFVLQKKTDACDSKRDFFFRLVVVVLSVIEYPWTGRPKYPSTGIPKYPWTGRPDGARAHPVAGRLRTLAGDIPQWAVQHDANKTDLRFRHTPPPQTALTQVWRACGSYN